MICNDTTQQGLILDPISYHIFCSLGISDRYLTAGPYVSHGTLTLLHTDGGGEGGRGSLFSTTKPIPKPGATSIVLVLWGPFTLSLHCLLQLYVHQPVKSETSLNISPLKLTCQEVLQTFSFLVSKSFCNKFAISSNFNLLHSFLTWQKIGTTL